MGLSTKLGIATAGLIALAGCTTGAKTTDGRTSEGLTTDVNYQRPVAVADTPWNQGGAELRRVTQDDVEYDLEAVVVNGQGLFVHQNPYRVDGELDASFIRTQDATLISGNLERDGDNGVPEVYHEFESRYIPTQVMLTPDKAATIVPLATTGQYAIKSDRTQFDLEGVQTGIIRTNQTDNRHNIRTTVIPGLGEVYTPAVKDADMGNPDALDFYVVQVEGADVGTRPDGSMFLRTYEGVFRPTRIDEATYQLRELDAALANPDQTRNHTGQAAGDLE